MILLLLAHCFVCEYQKGFETRLNFFEFGVCNANFPDMPEKIGMRSLSA